MNDHTFRLGMFLNELRLPLEAGLDLAQELAIDYVWFGNVMGRPPVAELSDDEIDAIGESITGRGLTLMVAAAGNPFKMIDLTTVTADALEQHAEFARDFSAMVRSMEIANRLGAGAVSVYSFAWPGEYTAGKPTWPMRWLTRGGVISDGEMEKLVQAYTLMVEQAERHQVDLVLSMMPWNYTNTTGNFRRLAETRRFAAVEGDVGPGGQLQLRRERRLYTAGFPQHQAVPALDPPQGPAGERRPGSRLRLRAVGRGRHRLRHGAAQHPRCGAGSDHFGSHPLDACQRLADRGDANPGSTTCAA